MMTKKALVVGAAGGVGTEVVKQLLGLDYSVVGTVRDDAQAVRLKAEIPGMERVLAMDLADADNVVATLKQHITDIDVVVVCAGTYAYGPLEICSLANLRRTLEINTVSALAVYQATMPLLRKSKGRILLMSSFAGKVGLTFFGPYVASKHALEGMGDVMRREAKNFGVNVILVEPGGIRTPMVTNQQKGVAQERANLSPADAALYGDMYDSVSRMLNAGLERTIEPTAVADLIVSALSEKIPAARYQIGDDSKFFCKVARKPDEEIDATVASVWIA